MQYVYKLGVGEDCSFVDVFDLTDFDSIPKPVVATLLLFPFKEVVRLTQIFIFLVFLSTSLDVVFVNFIFYL